MLTRIKNDSGEVTVHGVEGDEEDPPFVSLRSIGSDWGHREEGTHLTSKAEVERVIAALRASMAVFEGEEDERCKGF